jgi:hypothetical protein
LLYWIRSIDSGENKCDRVTAVRVRQRHAAVMVAPISLRIRHAEATARARKILRNLDEADRLQRRVRWLAMKAIVSIREMGSVAAPKLRSMYSSDRDRWLSDCKTVESILLKISKRGVG